MHSIFLALGSNVGNKKENILQARNLLKEKITNIHVAPFYSTKPLYFENQDTFMNTVMSGKTKLSPEELLTFTQEIEEKVGRIKRFKNGPREVDIDILFYDDFVLSLQELIIPHPKLYERDFVLVPLADIAPDFIDPAKNKSIKQLLEELPKEGRTIIQ